MAGKVAEIGSSDFTREVIQSEMPVVVDFWAEWCAPCLMLAPVMNELAQEYDGKIKFCKVNVDQNHELAGRYGIMGIPTLLFFSSGQVKQQLVGVYPKPKIKQVLDSLV